MPIRARKPSKRPHLYINSKKILFSDILANNKIWASPQELLIIDFCRKWLSGEQNFTLQTSGSTGTPKQITLTRKQMEASAKATISYLPLNKTQRVLICISPEYIGGIMMLVRCLVADMLMIVVTPTANPLKDNYLDKIAEISPDKWCITFTAFAPLQLQTILTETPKKLRILDEMDAIIVGGASLSLMQENLFKTITTPVYHTYGMTETASHIALRHINPVYKFPINLAERDYFHVLPNVKIRTDERGCLVINAESTNFEDVVTNDLVEILADNKQFKILGRIDNIINSGGVKIQLEKIEKNIGDFLSSNDLKEYSSKNYYCAGLADDTLGQRLVIVFEGEYLSEEVEKSLLEYLKIKLGQYEVPKKIIYKTAFERTETGKIVRK